MTILGFPVVSVILLAIAFLIVLVMILSLVAQSMAPTLPPPIFSEWLMEEYFRDMERSHRSYVFWGITAVVLCLLAVITAL